MFNPLKPVYKRNDQILVIENERGPIAIDATYPEWDEVQNYLLDHPDALQPEPLPPPPTDAQLEAAAESQRQARFAEYDTAIMRLKRAERLGDTTATASIAQWDAYAVALQALNDAPGWYCDTVWPTKPEV